MKQSRSGSVVGYNVQNVVDADSKLIIAHEVANLPSDRGQLLIPTMLRIPNVVLASSKTSAPLV
jgi:hypothetical protein